MFVQLELIHPFLFSAKINELQSHLELEKQEREKFRILSKKYSAEIDKNECEINRLKKEVEMKSANRPFAG